MRTRSLDVLPLAALERVILIPERPIFLERFLGHGCIRIGSTARLAREILIALCRNIELTQICACAYGVLHCLEERVPCGAWDLSCKRVGFVGQRSPGGVYVVRFAVVDGAVGLWLGQFVLSD